MLEYPRSMKQARIILAMLEADQHIDRECLEPNVQRLASVYIYPHMNGRELGYALFVTDGLGNNSKLITFAQHRVSDDTVVRVGEFAFQLTDEWYQKATESFFAWNDYKGAVDYIIKEAHEIILKKDGD